MEKQSENWFDVLVVGAGISGINAGYRLQTQCPDLTYTILEARDSMGGTWDLFKYPGIRSDSDLHTFGFPWRPWNKPNAIADGPSIINYIKETASIHGIDKNIRYHHKLIGANWSSDQQAWSLDVEVDGKHKRFNGRFFLLCTGYYDYDEPLPSTIPGLDNFKGTVVHPQFWPEDLEYTNKRMVVVGSGATAITLLPVLGEKAAHVTMVQRSPGYIISLPQTDALDSLARRWLPEWIAHKFTRVKFLVFPFLFFKFCRAFPNAARKVLRRRTNRQLPGSVPHNPHFEPSYNPWEQRLCVAPDGDFYRSLRKGTTSVATGHIKTITEDSVILEEKDENGNTQTIPADIIVTATGLKIQLAGGASISVDGEPLKFSDKFLWKGVMLQDVPNSAFVLGYTNASWTLGADATAQHVCRLLNHMKSHGMTSAVPRLEDSSELHELPMMNLNSTYIKSAEHKMPKAGDKGPWQARSNYFTDLWHAKFGNLTEGLQLYRVSS